MSKLFLFSAVSMMLAACGGTTELPTQDLRDMKPGCVAGDMAVCAEIGHEMRKYQSLQPIE